MTRPVRSTSRRSAVVMATALMLATFLVTTEAHAQRRSDGGGLFDGPLELGPRIGRDFEDHAWSLGAQVSVPLGHNIELRPSGDLFFPKHGKTGHQLNADADLRFGEGGFYAGGGLAWVDLAESGGKKRGHNLFFGIGDRPGKKFRAFAEFRWTFYDDTSPFRLAAGFNLALANL